MNAEIFVLSSMKALYAGESADFISTPWLYISVLFFSYKIPKFTLFYNVQIMIYSYIWHYFTEIYFKKKCSKINTVII